MVKNKAIKFLLLSLGIIFSAIGFIGIFIPLLPTTPFLLLSAACFVRSSDRFYNWLINNKWLGTYIKDYREKKGLKLSSKIFSISLLNISIFYTVIFAVDEVWLRILLLLIALSVTIHLLRMKTLKD